MMNLAAAVMMNSALEQAMHDKDTLKRYEKARKKKFVKDLRNIFKRLDEDGSGQVSRDEILNISNDDKEVLHKLPTLSDPLEIFGALDVDGSGNVDIE